MALFKNKSVKEPEVKKGTAETIVEYAQALVGAIVLAVIIRGFIFEPFKIPSESMVPTLLVGDHIFVKRYAYGLRVPFTKTWLSEFDDPKRGDVVVFTYPQDEDSDFIKRAVEEVDFIKRVIGVPGDKIRLKDGKLYVNDKEIEAKDIELTSTDPENRCWMDVAPESEKLIADGFGNYPYYNRIENFQPKLEILPGGAAHLMQRSKVAPRNKEGEWVVGPREFFVMGDNRDESEDSRFWGFVPRENLKGKAEFIWLSINYEGVKCPTDVGFFKVRWDRFGKRII